MGFGRSEGDGLRFEVLLKIERFFVYRGLKFKYYMILRFFDFSIL